MRTVALLVGGLAVTAVAAAGNPPDPRQTHVVATGTGPCGIAARDGSIWVGVYGSGQLLGISGTRGRIHTRVQVGRWACRVAAGSGALWVTRDRAGEVVRVPRRGGRLDRISVGRGAFDVLIAAGSVWATSYETGVISEIDPGPRRITRVFKDGSGPAGLTRCSDLIWVGHGGRATWLSAIDPETNTVRHVDVGTENPGWPRCVRGMLWVTAGDTLLEVDPTTGKVRARLRLGGTLAEAADGPDALVWVTDKERSLVHRIWAGGASVSDQFAAGPGAFALARVGDSMWVTSFAGTDVRRYDP